MTFELLPLPDKKAAAAAAAAYLLSLFPHTSRWGGLSLRSMQVKSPSESPTHATALPVSRLHTWI